MTRTVRRAALGASCALALALAATTSAQRPTSPPTGEIAGVVSNASVPQKPLARVLVTARSDALKASRTLITDDQGRFDFRDLPAGTYGIGAARAPYVTTTYGAKRPGRPGTPIALAAGQHVTGLAIPLMRGAVLTGLIRDASGDPAPGTHVSAVALDAATGATPASGVADDRGVYRIFGLSPGRYAIRTGADVFQRSHVFTQMSDAEMDQVLARLQARSAGGAGQTAGRDPESSRPDQASQPASYDFAPIYYPGSPDPTQADMVSLAAGEERTGIDVSLQRVRTATIEGVVANAAGPLPARTVVTLTAQIGDLPTALRPTAAAWTPNAAGAFHFSGVVPGSYRVFARATSGSTVLWALTDITVNGSDVSGMTLTLQPGLRLSGRVAFDSATRRFATDLTTIRVHMVDTAGQSNFVPPSGRVRADGSFQIDGVVPGTYGMAADGAGAGWRLQSVNVDGRDVLDVPLEISAGDISGVVATFTDRHTELDGTLETPAGIPAPDYFVVVFSSSRQDWHPGTRRIQYTRPSTQGRFVFRDLPAGGYLIAALTDLEPSDLNDPAFVDQLTSAAQPVHLDAGATKTQNLRLVR